jgi:peptidoglycan/LPS O-acetylase OafA/YrhL
MQGSGERAVPAETFVSVQILRALAALVVVAVHIPTEVQYGMGWGEALPLLLNGGAAADLFFVISGFVIVHSSEAMFGRADAPRVFFLRRLARIVPLYWLTSALILAMILLFYKDLSAAVHSVGSVVASFALVPYPRPNGVIFPLNPPGWTMPYEMFFYAVFAVALLLSRARAVLAVTLFFAALAVIGLIVPLPYPFAGWCDPLMLDFCFGMGIALAYRAGWRMPFWLSCLCVIAALAAYVASGFGGGPHVAWRVVEWGVPSAILLAGIVLSRAQPAPGRLARAVAFLGAASYSLYLVHPLVLPIPRRILRHFVDIPQSPWIFAAVLLVAAVVAAILCYLLFERPLTRALYRRIGGVRAAPSQQPAAPDGTNPSYRVASQL